jgi:hypothetical protein
MSVRGVGWIPARGTRYVAPYKWDFWRGSRSFLRASSTVKIEKVLISLIIGSSEGGFRSRDERKQAEKKSEIRMKKK